MQIAEKTYADYKLTAVPTAAGHSSAPRPDNAIYALANALTAVERHRFAPMINDATRATYEALWRRATAANLANCCGGSWPIRRTARPPICWKPWTVAAPGRAALPRCCRAVMRPMPCHKRPKPTSIAGFSPVSKSKRCASSCRRWPVPMLL